MSGTVGVTRPNLASRKRPCAISAWASAWTFLYLNGVELSGDFDVDAAERFMYAVAQDGALPIDEIARSLASFAS